MSFDLWGFNKSAYFSPPAGTFGYLLVGLYALVGLWALVANLAPIRRLKSWQWAAFLCLMLAGPLLAQTFLFRFPANILPRPGVPVESLRPGLALFAWLPVFLAAGWLGIAPALLVGFFTGLARAGWETYSWLTPFEYMLFAGVVAWAL